MNKIGWTDPKWSPKTALQLEIEREDLLAWANRKVEPLKYEYKPAEFHLTETAKYVFGSVIHFISSLPKL